MAGKSWHLSRRTFLRGAGAAIALPLLDAMRPLTHTTAALAGPATAPAAAAAAPVRMAVLYFPNGVWTDAWIPKAKGADFELPYSLTPLESMKGDITVLSGLDKKASHSGDGHYAKTANFLTGGHVNKTTGKEISAGGTSLDQLVARHVGGQTPIPSLELGIDPVISGTDTNVGYTRLYGSYISWREPNVPVAREINPRAVYDRLFGPKDAHGRPTGGANRAADDDRSLLDLALADAGDLRRRVGRDDQVKLDEYLEAVRAAEKQIAFASKPDPRAWRPPTTPDRPAPPAERPPTNYLDHVRAMLDLMVLSFWTDSTRVATFMFANDVSPRNLSALIDGVSGGHHQVSHHQNAKDKIEQYKRINRWHVQQFAATLDKLRSIREGEGTLLDNSMLLFGSSMSDGNRHDPSNLPLVLAGRGGGSLQSGRHVASPGGTPLCNLYMSMLDRMGVDADRFGDSTGKLAGLEA